MKTSEQTDVDNRKRVVATSIASPVASLLAKYACHPIDTIKSKIQARASSLKTVG